MGICASHFTPDGSRLIVSCSNGRLLTVSVPSITLEDATLEKALEFQDLVFTMSSKIKSTSTEQNQPVEKTDDGSFSTLYSYLNLNCSWIVLRMFQTAHSRCGWGPQRGKTR